MKHTDVGMASDLDLLLGLQKALCYMLTPRSLSLRTLIPNLISLSSGSFSVPGEESSVLRLSSHNAQILHVAPEANIVLGEADMITALLSSLAFSMFAFHRARSYF